MFEWTDFDTVFEQKPDFSYDTKTVEHIRKRRREYDGKLFLDRILENIGLKNVSKLYPPTSNSELRTLFTKIVKTSPAAPPYQKHAILFYILKDAARSLSDLDRNFVRHVYLPHKYLVLITGLWHLDHGQLSTAVDCLSEPCLTPGTFTDEILYTLLRHEKHSGSDGSSLAMSYYLSVQPPLTSASVPDLLPLYFSHLARASVTQAYLFTQSQASPTRESLFTDLIISVLSPPPAPQSSSSSSSSSSTAASHRAARAQALISLPLTADEQTQFEAVLLHDGVGSGLPNARDTVLARRVAMGQDVGGVGALDRTRGPKIHGTNWDDLRASLGKAGA